MALTKRVIENKVKEVLAQAKDLFGCTVRNVDIRYEKLETEWGKAGFDGKTKKWFMVLDIGGIKDDPRYVLNEIVPHELAHIVCMWLKVRSLKYGDDGHNAGWRHVAKALGSSGKRMAEPFHFPYETDSGRDILVNRKHHNMLQKEFKVLRTQDGDRITASGYRGEYPVN